MDLEKHKDGTYRVWISKPEYENLKKEAIQDRNQIIIRLAGECGLRSSDIVQLKPNLIEDPSINVNHKWIIIPKGKDTTGKGGKYRRVFLPKTLDTDIYRYIRKNNIAPNNWLFPSPKKKGKHITTKTVQRTVKKIAKEMTEKTGNEDWKYLSPHDLRAHFANYTYHETDVKINAIMENGGWESQQAMKPYINKPSEKTHSEEMRKAYK